MNYRKLTAVFLATVALAACSESGREETSALRSGTTHVTLQREGAEDITVYAFREQGNAFLYDTLFREGWTTDGRLRVRMPGGRYKFLFAAGAGNNLALQPGPVVGQTSYDETAFTLIERSGSPGSYLPADELFLQHTDAGKVYKLDGNDLTIPARLTRAVCRISVSVKRGYHDGTGYEEIPYAASGNILEEVAGIGLEVRGAGLRVRPEGSEGEATVTAALTADNTQLDDKGFLQLEGPCILPPAVGTDVGVTLSVTPAAGSHLQPAALELTGKAERNKRLEITLWITAGHPTIGIEIRVAPIEHEQEGDSGIWE